MTYHHYRGHEIVIQRIAGNQLRYELLIDGKPCGRFARQIDARETAERKIQALHENDWTGKAAAEAVATKNRETINMLIRAMIK
jgi:hypothetical protein